MRQRSPNGVNVSLAATIALLDVEGEVVGKTEEEVEHVFYGDLPADGQLGALAQQAFVKHMLQEQAQGTLAFNRDMPKVNTTLRVRRVNREKSVLTRKTYTDGMVGVLEKSVEISDDAFTFFTEVFGTGIAKMRYEIEVPGFKKPLQLDVFVNKMGHPTLKAKYDYEVPANQPDAPIPPLPITLNNMTHFNPFNHTDEDRMKLRAWMQSQGFRYD